MNAVRCIWPVCVDGELSGQARGPAPTHLRPYRTAPPARDQQRRSVQDSGSGQRNRLVEYLAAIQLDRELIGEQRVGDECVQRVHLGSAYRLRGARVDADNVPHFLRLHPEAEHVASGGLTDRNHTVSRAQRVRERRAHAVTVADSGSSRGIAPTPGGSAVGSEERNRATCPSNMYDDPDTTVSPSRCITPMTSSSPPMPRIETNVGPSMSRKAV